MEGGNPLPPLFMRVPAESVSKRIGLGEDLGGRNPTSLNRLKCMFVR